MDVEDQIRRRFDALAESLKNELSRKLQVEADELAAIVEAERAGAAAEATSAARETAERDATARIDAAVTALEARHASDTQDGSAVLERVAEAVREIDRARSLSEILGALTAAAKKEAERV